MLEEPTLEFNMHFGCEVLTFRTGSLDRTEETLAVPMKHIVAVDVAPAGETSPYVCISVRGRSQKAYVCQDHEYKVLKLLGLNVLLHVWQQAKKVWEEERIKRKPDVPIEDGE